MFAARSGNAIFYGKDDARRLLVKAEEFSWQKKSQTTNNKK